MKIKSLPLGYYAVSLDVSEEKEQIFTFKGVEYRVEPGVNLFTCLNDAYVAAKEIPSEILNGLNYEKFDTPVVIMSSGTHKYNNGTPGGRSLVVDHSVAILGEGASVSPNARADDKMSVPMLNPARASNETELVGSFWWGRIIIGLPGVEKLILDGLTLSQMCIEDNRYDEDIDAYISCRNIIFKSHTFRTSLRISPPARNSALSRTVDLLGIRIDNLDDLNSTNYFITPKVDKLTLDDVVVNETNLLFGFTTISKDFSNIPENKNCSEINIKNSFFRAISCENCISASAHGANGKSFKFTVEDTVFSDASKLGVSAINALLPNESCRLILKNCSFSDSRGNSAAAVSVFDGSENVTLENCSFSGFSSEVEFVAPVTKDAPDFIENRNTDWETKSEDSHTVLASGADFSDHDAIYKGRSIYYGDLHVHTDCGGTSDGHVPMKEWPEAMDKLDLDFAAIVDHKQMRGFFLPEWDEERFIIGTEPGSSITDAENCKLNSKAFHYNMMFPHKYGLAMVLANFPEFEYSGDELTGSYKYPGFTKARFMELVKYINSIGGLVVHAHPKLMMYSDDPLNYYMGEYSYLETLYERYNSNYSVRDYELWKSILALGKHVYASGGSDTHNKIQNNPVSSFYSKEKSGRAFFDVMKSGDFSVGAVGIQMSIDGNAMGSVLEYRDGMTLKVRVGDFYKHEWKPESAYEIRIISDKGTVYSSAYNGKLTQSLAIRVKKRAYYFVEIFDLTHGYVVSHSNPIWLDKEAE